MLKGRVVGLRAIEEADLEQLLMWRNQPEYRKFFREYRELNMINQKIWFEQKVINDEHTRMFSIIELDRKSVV